MGLFKELFIKQPNYMGQTLFEKDIATVSNAINQHMTSWKGLNMQQVKNIAMGFNVILEYHNPRNGYCVSYSLSNAGQNQTQATINIRGSGTNAEENFKALVSIINKKING